MENEATPTRTETATYIPKRPIRSAHGRKVVSREVAARLASVFIARGLAFEFSPGDGNTILFVYHRSVGPLVVETIEESR